MPRIGAMGFGIPASIQAEVTCSFGEVTEEKKLPSFTRVKQCQYWVSRRGRCALEHLTRALHAAAQILDESTHKTNYWVTIKLWFRKPKCVVLSNSRELDEHAGGTNRPSYRFMYLTFHRQRGFLDAASLPTVTRMKS